MTKTIRTSLVCLCAAFVSLTAAPAAEASANLLDPIRIWGPVTSTSTEGEDARFFSLDNQSGQSYQGELRITVSKVYTRVLDAVTGQPCPVEDIRPGETAYVYIGPAMTMSQPPMANASMILCNIPADFRVPDYLKVASLEWNEDRTEALLTSTGGEAYTVAADCETTPYLSTNIVSYGRTVRTERPVSLILPIRGSLSKNFPWTRAGRRSTITGTFTQRTVLWPKGGSPTATKSITWIRKRV